jgi:hypothetical protein
VCFVAVLPHLPRRQDEDDGQQRNKHRAGNDFEQLSADHAAQERTGCHGQHEGPVRADDGEAPVLAVAGEADEHGRQADRQRKAPGQLDVHPEQQDQGRDEQLPACNTEQGGDHPDAEASRHARHELGQAGQQRRRRRWTMAQRQHRGGGHEQQGDDPVEGARRHAGGPHRTQPRPDQAAGEKVDDHGPGGGQCRQRHGRIAERQRRDDHHQAHGPVQDDGLQGGKAERPDQQGEAEFSTAQADQPAKHADRLRRRPGGGGVS